MPSFLYHTFFCFILFLCAHSSTAQLPIFNFHRLSTEDQLSAQSFNYYLFKDSKGFVWISSVHGLNRFDGQGIRQYHAAFSHPDSLADENIHSHFFEDRNQDLWFSTNKAIHRYIRRNDHFERYVLPESTEGVEHQVMLLDTLNNGLWVRNKNQLYFFEHSNRTSQLVGTYAMNHRSRMFIGADQRSIYLFSQDSTGLRIRTFNHLAIERDTAVLFPPTTHPGFYISYLFYENDQSLWLAADTGLIKVDIPKLEYQIYNKKNQSIVDGMLDVVAIMNSDSLMVSTKEKGVLFFDKGRQTFTSPLHQSSEEGLAPFLLPVYRMYLDPDHNLWMHVLGKGIYFVNLRKRKFETYLQKMVGEQQAFDHIKHVMVDAEGLIWCLSRNGVIVVNEKGEEQKRYLSFGGKPLIGNEPYRLFEDSERRIWLGTQKGAFILANRKEEFKQVQLNFKPLKPGISYITELKNGKILASSLSEGILEWKEEEKRLARFDDFKSGKKMYTWIHEWEDRIFFYEDGVQLEVYQKAVEQLHYERTIIPESRIMDFVKDHQRKKIWLPSENGLHYINERTNRDTILQDTIVKQRNLLGAMIDRKGYLWISSKNGLYRYYPEKKEVVRYDLSDGLQSLDFNLWAFDQTQDGLFIFGGVNGINVFDPIIVKAYEGDAKPELTKLLVNDASLLNLQYYSGGINNISEIEQLTLPYDSNTLSFNFAALEYSHPEVNEFRYLMENVDEDTVYNGTNSFVRYPNLPPGQYTFLLDASNSDGVWSKNFKKLAIEILPPIWQTWWFRTLVAIVIILIIYAIYRYRIAQVRKQETFLRKEAEYKQMLAETETAILRLQMNPHFIFNSLSSIGSYVLQEKTDEAYDYLVDFSKLMRMILDFAEQPFIVLADEISLLQRYVKLEAIRFNKAIKLQVDISPELDAEEVELPTMILQPFIENAILHGLAPKLEGGLIKIIFQVKEHKLHCIIEDNGIGREAAKAQNRRYVEHESKALTITQRRLALLSKQKNKVASFAVEDLRDQADAARGTRIVLRLPTL